MNVNKKSFCEKGNDLVTCLFLVFPSHYFGKMLKGGGTVSFRHANKSGNLFWSLFFILLAVNQQNIKLCK
jgi:hypothetical protein